MSKVRDRCHGTNNNEPVKLNIVLQSDTDPGSDVPPAGILGDRCSGRSLEY